MKKIYNKVRQIFNKYQTLSGRLNQVTTMKNVLYAVFLSAIKAIMVILIPSLLTYNFSIFPIVYQFLPYIIYILFTSFLYFSLMFYYKALSTKIDSVHVLNTRLLLKVEFGLSFFVTTVIFIIFLSFI